LQGLLPRRVALGRTGLTVGPYTALNFPWIVLDRAIGTLAYVMTRAHARRDVVTLQAEQLQALLASLGLASTGWSDADRRQCERTFAQLRKGRLDAAGRAGLLAVVRRRIAFDAKPGVTGT
jgi:hypothetical protein